jgi:hypothetical protein
MCSKVEERAPEQEERDEKLSRHINYKKRTSFSLFISPFSLFQRCAPPACVLLFSAAESATRPPPLGQWKSARARGCC